jgi:putative transposase
MKRTRPWELSDEVWERVRPLIPERAPHPKGGRPAEDDRQMLAAILYVLRTGIQWNALPRELGASTTVYDRFRLWEQQGVFERIWQAGLEEYDELEGIAWEWQSMDGVMRHLPLSVEPRPAPIRPIAASGEPSAASPSDGRGMPLAVVVDGANRTDMKLAEATLDAMMIARPIPTKEQPQHLCLDAGYDYDAVYETVRAHDYEPHIRPNLHNQAQARPMLEPEKKTSSNLESTKQPRRWVVETTHSQYP